jgi:hypothetical protein
MQQKDNFSMAGGKRDDPNYLQVSGYVPRDLGLQFKANCMLQEVSQSEALEEAIQLWLKTRQTTATANLK